MPKTVSAPKFGGSPLHRFTMISAAIQLLVMLVIGVLVLAASAAGLLGLPASIVTTVSGASCTVGLFGLIWGAHTLGMLHGEHRAGRLLARHPDAEDRKRALKALSDADAVDQYRNVTFHRVAMGDPDIGVRVAAVSHIEPSDKCLLDIVRRSGEPEVREAATKGAMALLATNKSLMREFANSEHPEVRRVLELYAS